nr:aldolase [Paenibacillus castaneae]
MSAMTRVGYIAFGLKISSEIQLPELVVIKGDIEQFDVDVEVVIDSKFMQRLNVEAIDLEVNSESVTFQIPNAGVFRVSCGNKIVVSPYSNADEDLIRLYILGTCMGVVLMQRSIYPLHGSAVVINGNAYAIVGESGAGKSTLASAFTNRGYQLVTDDIVALTFTPSEELPIVTPSYPQQKLWQQSLDAFGINNKDLRSIFGRESKYCVSIEDRYCNDPIKLAGIFELEKSENDEISIQRVGKLESLPLLFQNTYKQFLIPRMMLLDWHFGFSTKLGERLPIYRMKRSTKEFSAPQLVDLILKKIETEG